MIPFNDKFHAQAIARIIDAMKEPDKTQRWDSGSDVSEWFGWDGCTMSPVTRVSFVNRYGEEVAAKLEAEANAEIESCKAFGENYRKHEAEAVETAKKPVSEWTVGDFVAALDCGSKFDHEDIHKLFWHFVEGEAEDANNKRNQINCQDEYRNVRSRLCKITRIIEKPAGFFNDNHALTGYKPQDNEGGSASDDISDDEMKFADLVNLPKERRNAVYSTFYSLCVLIRTTGGEWVLVNAEGYSYARYVLVPENYREMFAPVIEGIRAKKEFERKEAEAAAKAAHEKAKSEAATNRNRSAKVEAAPAAGSLDGEVSVTENAEKNGIEIRFAHKPSAEVLERIKGRRCWRWSRFSKCWYTRANATEREFAHALAAGTDTNTARHEDVPGNLDAMLGY